MAYCTGAIFLPLAFLLLVALGCNSSALHPARYMQWVEDEKHGFLQREETPAFRYTLLFKPKPYEVLKGQPEAGKDQLSYDAAEKNLDDLNYASLWLETADGTDPFKKGRPAPEELERRVYYCSFGIQQDLALVEGTDTLSCVFAHWERLGSITSRQHFILAFEKSRGITSNDKVFFFKNRMLEEETVRFQIFKSAIDQLPALRF